MEYKKWETIDRDEFKAAIADTEARFKELDSDAPFINSDANPADEPGRGPNHITLMKQSAHYASKYETKFVALCDYKTLLLLVMVKVGSTLHGGRVSRDVLIPFEQPC